MNRPDDAFAELQFGFGLTNTFRDEPTMIDGLVRITALGILMQPIWEGISAHRWNAEQLAALENDLRSWDFLADFDRSMRTERGSANWLYEKIRNDPTWLQGVFAMSGSNEDSHFLKFLGPAFRASMYRNQILINTLIQEKFLTIMDGKAQTVNVARANEARKTVGDLPATPYTFLVKIMMPVFTSVTTKHAQAQTYVNESAIACEIERYRLTHGALPATLEALQMPGLPHDVIGGQSLHYKVISNDNYLLYSIGWNETDDGGKVVMRKDNPKNIDFEQGDWVWSLKPL